MTLLAMVGIGLAGCGGWVRDNLALEPKPWRRVATEALPVTVSTPPGMTAVAARMRTTGDIYKTYHVVFGNPTLLAGENRLTIDVQTLPDSPWGVLVQPAKTFPVPLYTLNSLTVTTNREFPAMRVKVAEAPRRNRYGVYDYVVAQDGVNTCVLAWQLIDDHTRILPERIEAVRLDYRMCGVGGDARAVLAPFDDLVLTLPETILEAQEPAEL